MKKEIYSATLFLFLISPLTRADIPGNADDVTKIVNAQVQVTRDNLASLQDQLGSLAGNPYDDASYRPLAEKFKQSIDAAFAKFDQAMSGTVLPEAQYWLNRHVALAKTMGSSPELVNNTMNQMKMVSKDYQSAILGIYQDVVGDLPIFAKLASNPQATEAECGKLPDSWARYAKKKKVQLELTSFRIQLDKWKSSETVLLPYCHAYLPGYDQQLLSRDGGKPSDLVASVLSDVMQHGEFPQVKYYIYEIYHSQMDFESEFGVFHRDNGSGYSSFNYPLPDEISPAAQMLKRIVDASTAGCATQKCRQLRINDFLQFVSLVQATIDKDIGFKSVVGDERIALESPKTQLMPLLAALRGLALKIQ